MIHSSLVLFTPEIHFLYPLFNLVLIILLFFIHVSTCMDIALYISSPPFSSFLIPSLFPFLLVPFHSHSLLCGIAFARGYRETAENLCRYSRPFSRVCIWKNDLLLIVLMCRPTVTRPSTNPALRYLTWVIACHRTPTTHRTLSVDNPSNNRL